MKTSTAFFLFTFLSFSSLVHGDMLREIELIDGSTIRAQVLSMDGKTYRLRSEILGDIDVPEYRIKAIRTPRAESTSPQSRGTATPTAQPQSEPEPTVTDNNPPSISPPPAAIPSAGDLQQAFSQDPTAMNKILSLQDDPLVQDILRDEQLMQAIHSGNLGALMNDPKIRALMSNPTVRDLSSQYER